MAWLRRAGVPVMASEAEHRLAMHQRLVEEGAVSFLQVAPVACGGISRLRELSELVAGTDIRLSLEVSSTALALLAACHFAASVDAVVHVEWHSVHQVFFDTLPEPRISGGQYQLPQGLGIGIDVPVSEMSMAFESRI